MEEEVEEELPVSTGKQEATVSLSTWMPLITAEGRKAGNTESFSLLLIGLD